MTLMDMWILGCILYLEMQLLVYTVNLYILLTDDKVGHEMEKKSKIVSCHKIDSWARKAFLVLEVIMIGAYSVLVIINA